MKKILLFGKLNEITKDINAFLSNFFQVQVCSDHLEIAKGMLDIYTPDIVIISLIGLYEVHNTFFTEIYENYRDTPVITIGMEYEKSLFEPYYEHEQFQNLVRPLDNIEIMEEVCNRLALDMEEIISEYERRCDTRKHIMLVDDDVVFLRNMKEVFELDYQVSIAVSVAQAMTIMGKRQPDLLILDYDMPVCDGKRMLEMIRSEERLRDIPVIFLTGISQKEHITKVLDLKPQGYFLKPPVIEEVDGAIKRILQN